MTWVFVVILVIVIIYLPIQRSRRKAAANKEGSTQEKSKGSGYGKWVGGGLGWAVGGPIGGLLGFMFGSMLDGSKSSGFSQAQGAMGFGRGSGDFNVSLMVLAAAVMKADGKVLKSELEYVKAFLAKNYSASSVDQLLLVLRDVLKKDIPLADVCVQIRSNMGYETRLQLLHFLFGIGLADSDLSKPEIEIIHTISHYLGISRGDFDSVKAMFVKNSDADYQVLGITKNATDDEVKKAFRAMAVKHHPDKVAHLGEELQDAAKIKFQKINDAYDSIKKSRGLK